MRVNTDKRPKTCIAGVLLCLAGQGSYCNGIPADCSLSDDVDFAPGNSAEPRLPDAPYSIHNLTCPVVPWALPPGPNLSQGLQLVTAAI